MSGTSLKHSEALKKPWKSLETVKTLVQYWGLVPVAYLKWNGYP